MFGHIVAGMDVVREIENLETDGNDSPYARVTVLKCGELMLKAKKKKGVSLFLSYSLSPLALS